MKKQVVFLYAMVASIMLCGCGNTIPEMTDTETAVVTEYATNLLVKYSTLSDRALLNEEQLEEGIIKEAEERERLQKVKELENMYLNGTVESADIDELNVDTVDEDAKKSESDVMEMPTPQLSVSEFFAENNFLIDYSSYKLCQSYPAEDAEDVFMSIDSASGKQLCVVKFNVSNLTSSEQPLDMYAKRGRFSLRMDGGSVVSAQSTLLMDDLSSYIGTIQAGETEELVLIFEVPDSISQIGSMELIMKDQSGENTLTLQ